jgi:hypothetical protein
LTIQAEKLRKENTSQSDLVTSTRNLITTLIKNTSEERLEWHSTHQSQKIEDEVQTPDITRAIQHSSGDFDLVHALTNTMNNELTLFKLEHTKRETSLLRENEELKDRIDFLEREKNRLSADLVSLEHAQYENLPLDQDPSSMDAQQVKKVIGIVSLTQKETTSSTRRTRST